MKNQKLKVQSPAQDKVDYDSIILYGSGNTIEAPKPEFTVEDETGVYIRMKDGEITVEKPVKFEKAERTDAELIVELYLILVITTILLVVIRCHSLLKQERNGGK